MSLKSDVVIVNEFSVPSRTGGGVKGSRGATPGDYVLRYMARKGATEPLTPIRQVDHELFIRRYMAREDAVERLRDEQFGVLERELEHTRGQGGVAFGYGSFALSDQRLRHAAREIQTLFESGHTVMKTVISFDEEYLRANKLIPADFQLERAGDYRGQLDQLKLRLAIMRGLERMGSACFDDLRSVGVLQIDTRHVHAHLAMVDAGQGRTTESGTQRGRLGVRAKSLLRRGIDSYLDEKQQVAHLSSAVRYEQRNTTAFVKRWAFRKFREGSLAQSLVAALPRDRRLWRYGTNRREMHRALVLAVEFVEALLQRPDSGFEAAMERVRRYAAGRRRREGLTRPEARLLVQRGRERIVERSVNGVFAVLRAMPEEALSVSTPLLEAANADPVPDWDTPGPGGLMARLRIASARHSVHQRQALHYRAAAVSWREADEASETSPDSAVMVRLFDIEAEYHEACAAKYASLLPMGVGLDEGLQVRLESCRRTNDAVIALESMRADAAIKRLHDPAEAERLGLAIYGQEGGWLLSRGDTASMGEWHRRLDERRRRLRRDLAALRTELASRGLDLHDDGGLQVQPQPKRPELMAIDLHQAEELWDRDIPKAQRETFGAWARTRAAALSDAVTYLRESGQDEAVSQLSVHDIALMEQVAATGTVALPSQPAPVPARVRTVAVGAQHPQDELRAAVLAALTETVELDSDTEMATEEGLSALLAE